MRPIQGARTKKIRFVVSKDFLYITSLNIISAILANVKLEAKKQIILFFSTRLICSARIFTKSLCLYSFIRITPKQIFSSPKQKAKKEKQKLSSNNHIKSHKRPTLRTAPTSCLFYRFCYTWWQSQIKWRNFPCFTSVTITARAPIPRSWTRCCAPIWTKLPATVWMPTATRLLP